jgi:hypothetical protein
MLDSLSPRQQRKLESDAAPPLSNPEQLLDYLLAP